MIQDPPIEQQVGKQLESDLLNPRPPTYVPYGSNTLVTQSQAASGSGTSSTTSHKLPDSPPDSGSEPPFSPLNETDKLVVSSNSSTNSGHKQNGNSTVELPGIVSPTSGMENLKHFVDYTSHPTNPQQSQPSSASSSHIKLETSLNSLSPHHHLHQSVSVKVQRPKVITVDFFWLASQSPSSWTLGLIASLDGITNTTTNIVTTGCRTTKSTTDPRSS